MFILFIFLPEEYIISYVDKAGSSSLQSHIAYTENIGKIKQLKQLAGGRGDINIV